MDRIETVSPELRFLINKVQHTPELNVFHLAGGTNLALRFDHRVSVDIDLFTNKKIGIESSKKIIKKLSRSFAQFNPSLKLMNDKSNSKTWIRMMVKINNILIRFDIVQNVPFMFSTEVVNGIKMVHVKDIALMKIDSAIGRDALKDMYDLNYITDNIISLPELWELFKKRQKKFQSNTNTFTKRWDSINFFESLSDVIKKNNPTDLEKSVINQNGFPTITIAYNQWKQKVVEYSEILKKNKDNKTDLYL